MSVPLCRWIFLVAWSLTCGGAVLAAEDEGNPMQTVVYKTTPQGELTLDVYQPAPADGVEAAARPALVFFHGGGWNSGNKNQFSRQSKHLAARGMVAVSVQYRLKNDHSTTPIESARDAISAMRWVRAHAESLGIDPQRIGAGGGSAGGQLAAVTATLSDDAAARYDDEDEDRSVSFRPEALVLFNPVYDNGPDGYGHARFGDAWETFSPLHNLHVDLPPTLVMLGDQDNLIPVATAETFRDRMTQLGVRSELIVYPDQPHGFFNNADTGMFQSTVEAMDDFLVSLGWLEAK